MNNLEQYNPKIIMETQMKVLKIQVSGWEKVQQSVMNHKKKS